MASDTETRLTASSEPVRYIAKTRAWYGALGYPAYRWARSTEIPFTRLVQPIASSRLLLVTTAAPYREEHGEQGPGAPYNAEAKFFEVYSTPIEPIPDLRISHLAYDREQTTAEDPATWLPLPALREAVDRERLGGLCTELVGVPTDRSQSRTLDVHAPDVVERARGLDADLALLVPS